MADEEEGGDLFERAVDLALEGRERLRVECKHEPDLYAEPIPVLTADTNATKNDAWADPLWTAPHPWSGHPRRVSG